MKVSIAVTTYNHEKYIAQAIESILMQKVNFDYEIIIGEDCSVDNTRNIIIDFQKRYPEKIRLILPHENLGFCGSKIFLQTLQECRGIYIAFFDGDDYWTSPFKLQKQVDFLDQHPECVMCFHNALVYYENQQGKRSWTLRKFEPKEIFTIEDVLTNCSIHISTIMLRREVVSREFIWFNGIELKYLTDWTMVVLLAQYGKIGYFNEVMSVYRQHENSLWSVVSKSEQLHYIIKEYKYINKLLKFQYDAIIKTQLSKRYYELSVEYEKTGNYNSARTFLSQCIAEHSAWLEEYLPGKGSLGKKVWKYLDKKIWYYQHPILYRLWFKSLWATFEEFKALIPLIFRVFAKTIRCPRNKRTGILTADPNPIRQCNHTEEFGATTLRWISFGVENAEVHVGAPDGPLFSRSGSSGKATTGEWVHDGMVFYLQDVTGGLPLTYANTLDIVKINVITGKRGFVKRISDLLVKVIEGKKKKLLTKTSDSIWAYPNPIPVTDNSMVGKTTLFWTSQDTKIVEIHVDSPDGPFFSRSGSSGKATTGEWVHDGMTFYLQDVSDGLPFTSENTLAKVKIRVTTCE